MKAEHQKAFDKLRMAGIDVRESESEDYGIFWINCETDSVETELALEYYDNYWERFPKQYTIKAWTVF